MKTKFILLLTFCLMAFSPMMHAQSKVNISTDLASRYVWRGSLLGGSTPSVQPGLSYSYNGLEVGAWGAFSFSQTASQELDLFISYTFLKDMFTIMVTDYDCSLEVDHVNYFDYNRKSTPHVFEAGIVYNGIEKVPVSLGVYTNFYGADAKNSSGNNIYSTYAELAYTPTIEKLGIDLNIFAGAALNGQSYTTTIDAEGVEPATVETTKGFYNNSSFAVVNLGIQAIKTFTLIEGVEMPVSTALIFNPNDNKAYFVATVGISL